MKKMLKTTTPLIKTYQHSAYLEIVCSNDTRIDSWIINKYIQWNFEDDNLKITYANPWETVPFIQKDVLELKFIKNFDETIKDFLRNEYYVMFTGIDDFYLENSAHYQKIHMSHDIFIYGFDDDKAIYYAAGYTSNNKFQFYTFSQKNILEAINSQYITPHYSAIAALKLKPKAESDYNIDRNTIIRGFDEYLHPIKDINQNELVFGIDAYEHILNYLESSKIKSNTPLDLRMFRIIYEHKICMLKRIEVLHAEFNIFNNEVVVCKNILNLAENTFMLSIKYNNFTQDKKIILKLIDNIKKITELECSMITQILEKRNIVLCL